MNETTIYGIKVDLSRGFTVKWGSKSSAHFDTYEEACAEMRKHKTSELTYYTYPANAE